VDDFIDFLLVKEKKNTSRRNSGYKKDIMKVSVWEDADFTLCNK